LTPLGRELASVLADDPVDLARAALVIARLEYPSLDPVPTLATLSALGDRAAERLHQLDAAPVRTRIAALNRLIYREEHFAGNRAHYDDFRNSLLNVVLERRLGIPISLAVVYMEVARRAGLDVRGVAFPGHFLMRVANPAGEAGVILDPFDGGDEVDEQGCRQLLARRLGDDAGVRRGAALAVQLAANHQPHPQQPEADLHRTALVRARAPGERSDSRRRSSGADRGPRPRPHRVPPGRLLGRTARSRGLLPPADVVGGLARGARSDLGPREEPAAAARRDELRRTAESVQRTEADGDLWQQTPSKQAGCCASPADLLSAYRVRHRGLEMGQWGNGAMGQKNNGARILVNPGPWASASRRPT
jgi:hypothetical protein